MTLFFRPDFERGVSEIVEQVVKPKPKAVFQIVRVGPGLKVSCQKSVSCTSPSKRVKGFVCGSNFSHDDRCGCCVEYIRLCRRLPGGVRGGKPL